MTDPRTEELPDDARASIERLLNRIAKERWSPFDPFPECARALECPSIPEGVERIHGDGLRWTWIAFVLLKEFGQGPATAPAQAILPLLAVQHMMRQRGLTELSDTETNMREYGEILRWLAEDLQPAGDRLRDARLAGASVEDQARIEPAYTVSQFLSKLQLNDGDDLLASFRRGFAMHEDNTATPHREADRSWGELAAWLQEARAEGACFVLAGRVRIDPLRLKAALDRLLGRRKRARSFEVGRGEDKLDDEEPPRGSGAAPPAICKDSALDLAQVEEQGSAIIAALEALPRGVIDVISAGQHHLDVQALRDGLDRAARTRDPAMQAAIVRQAGGGHPARERLAGLFEVTVAQIRTAEKNLK